VSGITSYKAGKNLLDSLLSRYKKLLTEKTSLEQAFQSLCSAERYGVWKNGRTELTTLLDRDNFKLRQEEIPCHDSDLLVKEYKKINDKTPPRWFQCLAPWQQDFIRSNLDTLLEKSIPSSLRSVPGLANLSKHKFTMNGVESLSYFRHATPRPVDLMNNKYAYDEEYRLTCMNIASQIRLSLQDQFKQVGSKQIREAVILTQSLLSPGTTADLKSKISGPSDNDTEIYKLKEEVVELFQRALRTPEQLISTADSKIKALFFNENERTKAIYYKDFLAQWGLGVQSDGLFKYRDSQPLKITLLSTNRPLNLLRRGGAYSQQTIRNERNTALLLGALGRYLAPIFSENATQSGHSIQQYNAYNRLLRTLSHCEEEKSVSENDKKNLITILDEFLGIRHKFDENTVRLFFALQMLLSTPLDQGGLMDADVRHHQLMIGCAEAIILNCLNGSLWVACKSGKDDRTGVASAVYDATALYYNQYSKLPGCKDQQSDRTTYVTLIKELLESGHQQKAAAENAPGAVGIVELGMIVPGDVQINAHNNQLSTDLARLNKPSESSKGFSEFFKESIEKRVGREKPTVEAARGFFNNR
jgi:hypothetical protein